MANHRIWAPWRLAYVKDAAKDNEEECIFCAKPAGDDDEANLIVHRGERCFVILNLYPYTNGHLMVAPLRHVGDFVDLTDDEAAELHALTRTAVAGLRRAFAPHGFNVGWNLGRAAGAGVVDHVHQHVVPRWGGDTNFMPVLADVKVIPEHLTDTRRRLAEAWAPQ